VDNPSCATLFHVVPDYTTGWVEQLIMNHRLNISVYYAEWNIYEVVSRATARGQPGT
jgi:hypothetical protein